jgi:hypothetical protein
MHPLRRLLALIGAIFLAAASPAPAPSPAMQFSGRLLDLARGYCFFSTGDAYRLAPGALIIDQATGQPLRADDVTTRYGLASFAPDGSVTRLEVANRPFPPLSPPSGAGAFAVTASAPQPNPELIDLHNGYTGEPVLVIFTVEVPPTTGLTDAIYLSTEASGWDPLAIKMDRIDALHFRITRRLASGTKFVYRYTRGSWRSAERQENGLEGAPRTYVVQNLDVARHRDTVYHWGDENPSGGALPGPDAVPTPENGRAFQFGE